MLAKKRTIMKKKLFTFLMAILSSLYAYSEEQGYAVFDSETGTLTFKYGEKPEGDNVYDTDNTDYRKTSYDYFGTGKRWGEHEIIKVVFEASFANARPKSTAGWFDSLTESFTEFVDIKYLNTSEVTDMSGMFWDCWSVKSLDLSNFDTKKVTDMSYMFERCISLTHLDLHSFDTKEVTNMEYMFSNCQNITTLDLSTFNTEKVTNMRHMFDFCLYLNSIDVSSFNATNVTDMSYMFNDCGRLTSIDLSRCSTNNVINMSNLFGTCTSLTDLDISGFNTENVTDMSEMFRACFGLTTIDLSNFNTNKVENMNRMFYSCLCLTTIYTSEKWTINSLISYISDGKDGQGDLFINCNNLVGEKGTKYDANHTDATYARIDGGSDAPGYFTSKAGSPNTPLEPSSNYTGKLLKSITKTDGKKTDTAELKYDDAGRISEYYLNGKLQNKYSYTDNTITIAEGGDRYEYTISDGRITNSHIYYDSEYVDINQTFTYNSNSRLVSIVSTEKEQGHTYTSTSKWTWDGANLASWIGENDEDTETSQFSYYNDITAEPIVRALFGFNPSLNIDDFYELIAIYPYIGALPQGLFKNVVENDAEGRTWNYNYSYKQNSNGDIVEVTVTYTGHTYVYTLDWDNSGQSTGISFIENTDQKTQTTMQKAVYYNLQGQRVDNPSKGLYILNGRKVIVK